MEYVGQLYYEAKRQRQGNTRVSTQTVNIVIEEIAIITVRKTWGVWNEGKRRRKQNRDNERAGTITGTVIHDLQPIRGNIIHVEGEQ